MMDIAGTKARHRTLGEGTVVSFDLPNDIITLSFPSVGEKRYCASFVLDSGVLVLEEHQAEVAFCLAAYRKAVRQQERLHLKAAVEEARVMEPLKAKRKNRSWHPKASSRD